MSKKFNLHVAYGGPILDDGTMDVRDLAPALLAIGELLTEANSVLNGEGSALSVKVRSDFETGSFEIGLELIQSLASQVSFWLGADGKPLTPEQIVQMIGLYSGSGITLIKLIKYLKGKKVANVTTLESGNVQIEVIEESSANVSVEVPGFTFKLFKSRQIRKHLSAVLGPLKKPGVEYFEVRNAGNEPTERIEASEVDAFREPEVTEELLVNNVREGAFQILSTSFDEDLKWRVSDGISRFPVTMNDESFQKQIENGRPFSKGDTLIASIRTVQKRNSEGVLSTEHSIEKVTRHIRKDEQIMIHFEEPVPNDLRVDNGSNG